MYVCPWPCYRTAYSTDLTSADEKEERKDELGHLSIALISHLFCMKLRAFFCG